MQLRRSLHFVPGGNEKMLDKARGLAADALILDLEDSVVPDAKAVVRDKVCGWLANTDFGRQQTFVRINPLDSEWGRADLEAVVAHRPHGILLPKVVNRKMVVAADSLMSTAEEAAGIEVGSTGLILIGTETAASVFHLDTMADHPRVNGLTWGAEDLSASLGAKRRRDDAGDYLEVFTYVRSLCLLAAVAAEVQPLDAVYTDIKNLAGLKRECERAADMGYTGKLTIHPDQIDIVNAAFTPSDAEIAHAQELLDAFTAHEKAGKMAFSFKGQMVDVPHLRRARDVLALAAHIAGQTG